MYSTYARRNNRVWGVSIDSELWNDSWKVTAVLISTTLWKLLWKEESSMQLLIDSWYVTFFFFWKYDILHLVISMNTKSHQNCMDGGSLSIYAWCVPWFYGRFGKLITIEQVKLRNHKTTFSFPKGNHYYNFNYGKLFFNKNLLIKLIQSIYQYLYPKKNHFINIVLEDNTFEFDHGNLTRKVHLTTCHVPKFVINNSF